MINIQVKRGNLPSVRGLEKAMQDTVVKGYVKIFQKRLAPFEEEIEKADAEVILTFTDKNYNAEIEVTKVTGELKESINEALHSDEGDSQSPSE